MDKIKIRGLEIFANHGVFEEEKILGQKFIVNVDLVMSTRNAGLTDDLNKSVDYGAVCKLISEIMKDCNHNLIEAVAKYTFEIPGCAGGGSGDTEAMGTGAYAGGYGICGDNQKKACGISGYRVQYGR